MDSQSLLSKAAEFAKKNRQTVAIAGIAVVLIVAGMFLRVSPDDKPGSPRDHKGVDDFLRGLHVIGTSQDEAEKPAEPKTPPPATEPAVAPSATGLTYEQATEKYAGHRYQFVKCRGNPGTMVLTKGTKFMLDNRDSAAHTIVVGKASYRVAGLGFAIATASTVGMQNITCDGGGSASINVTP